MTNFFYGKYKEPGNFGNTPTGQQDYYENPQDYVDPQGIRRPLYGIDPVTGQFTGGLTNPTGSGVKPPPTDIFGRDPSDPDKGYTGFVPSPVTFPGGVFPGYPPAPGSPAGGGSAAPYPVITKPVPPEGPFPTIGEVPDFTQDPFVAPPRDEGRINELTQQKSAAGLRAMRSMIQRAMGQGYRNPNVKRMTLREALAGYGQGIESVMTGAQSAAGSEYGKEYETEYGTAGKNWQAQNEANAQNWKTKYEIAFQDWQNRLNKYWKGYGSTVTK